MSYNDDFCRVFDEQTEELDKFFHRKIYRLQGPLNIEDIKDELLQDTALSVLIKLRSEKYNDFSLVKLIWIKANDVWVEYVRNRSKKPPTIQLVEEIEMKSSEDNVRAIEITDELTNAKQQIDPTSWEMLKMFSEGHNYKEIAKHFQTSEDSVRSKIYRLRQKFRRS